MRNCKPTLLILSLGDDAVASSRIRAKSVGDYALKSDWQVTRVSATSPLWPLQIIYFLLTHKQSIFYIQKVIPPRFLTFIFTKLASEIVLDLDDAIYLGYPGEKVNKNQLWNRTIFLLKFIDRLSVSNRLIAEDLRSHCQATISILPGPAPEIETKLNPKNLDEIIWLGSPSTISNVRNIIYPEMGQLLDTKLFVVGAETDSAPLAQVEELRWSFTVQQNVLSRAHIGLLPQQASTWNDRKAAYKVLEYLANDVVPVFFWNPAVEELLGEELSTLSVVLHADKNDTWVKGIEQARNKIINDTWRRSRDAAFERLNATRFSKFVLNGITEVG